MIGNFVVDRDVSKSLTTYLLFSAFLLCRWTGLRIPFIIAFIVGALTIFLRHRLGMIRTSKPKTFVSCLGKCAIFDDLSVWAEPKYSRFGRHPRDDRYPSSRASVACNVT